MTKQQNGEIDVEVQNHLSLFIIKPLTERAEEWIDEHVDPEAMHWGNGIVVEPRYVDDLIGGMVGDGLTVG